MFLQLFFRSQINFSVVQLTLSHPMTPYGVLVSHKLMGIYMGVLVLGVYTIVRSFCWFKQFLMGGKELMKS